MNTLCLTCKIEAQNHKQKRDVRFKDTSLTIEYEVSVCPTCGLEFSTVDQAAQIQHSLAEAYRKQKGLMTASEIIMHRKLKGLSQAKLAELLDVGVASIKRWEGSLIQSRSMDSLLKYHLVNEFCCLEPLSGDREFSIPRVKLVLMEFEKRLKTKLLKTGDRLLYSAKYLWYADMISYRDLGKSMTGATYAALPQGPQLNNYRDLVPFIITSNEADADKLSDGELAIITSIANKFQQPVKVYKASHDEDAWKLTTIGKPISYRLANTISKFCDL
jgi:putative zinc finger/helix-turn-helix YgiT family protein